MPGGFARPLRDRPDCTCSLGRGRPSASAADHERDHSGRTSCRAMASRRRKVRIVLALAGKASARGVTFEGGVPGHQGSTHRYTPRRTARTPATAGPSRLTRADLRGHLGSDRRRAGRRAGPARSPCSTSWCGPIRSPSSADETAQRSCTDRCDHQDMSRTSVTARTTTGVGNYRHEPIVTPQRIIRRHGDGPMPVADAVHARRTSRCASAEIERGCSRRSPVAMRPADPARSIERDVLVHARRRLRSSASRANVRGAVALRGGVGHARRPGWAARSPSGW